MKKFIFLLFLFLDCFSFITAFAETQKLQLGVPQSSLYTTDVLRKKNKTPANLQLQASNWMPSQTSLESRSSNTSEFQKVFLPATFIVFESPFLAHRWGELSYEVGGGYLQLRRTANINYASAQFKSTQNLYLLMAKAQLVFSPSLLKWRFLSTYWGAGLAPIYAVSEEAAFSKSTSTLVWGYEGSVMLGARFGSVLGAPMEFRVGPHWMGELQKNQYIRLNSLATLAALAVQL